MNSSARRHRESGSLFRAVRKGRRYEQVAEQMVVAVPLPPGVEGDNEQVCALELLEQGRRVLSLGDGGAERRG